MPRTSSASGLRHAATRAGSPIARRISYALTYLIDVLQRINVHPDSKIRQLTPRLWKKHFADSPLPSALDVVMRGGSAPRIADAQNPGLQPVTGR